MDEESQPSPSPFQKRAQEEAEDFFKSVKIKTGQADSSSTKQKSLKLILIALAALLILAAIPLTLTLVKQRQEIREEATGLEEIRVTITEDDQGEYGIKGEKTGSHAYCCVTKDELEVASPKTDFHPVDSLVVQAHDHTASVAFSLEAHTETGWTVIAADVDIGSRNEEVCDEESPYYPDHGYPNNPNSATHDDPDSCYKDYSFSLGCAQVDKIRMKFFSTDGDDQKDKGEHLHLKDMNWRFCQVEVTPTPTPTGIITPTPEYGLNCQQLKAYDQEWQEKDLSELEVGETVSFLVGGLCDELQGITDARFRINDDEWLEPTGQKEGNFYLEYEIKEAGDYQVEAMVYNPVLGWR